MRILHFYKTYYPDTMGGTEQVINQLARACVALGVQTKVLSLSCQPLPAVVEIDGHVVHRVKTNFEIASMACSWSVFARFAELLKHVDVVHYHYPWPVMDLVHFVSRIKIPTVVTYHSDIVRQRIGLKLYRPLRRCFLSNVDSIVATSVNYLKTSLVLSHYRDKTTVIPIGIEESTYPQVSVELLNKWRKFLGSRFFLFVGMLRYYKGLHVLLEAIQGTDYPVVIVGGGPLEIELKAQAERLNLQNVYFFGPLSDEDKVALFKLCYAVVFPSHIRAEAFGISLLEGAMYGKPLISCEIGTGTSFINLDKKTGLVVEPGNAKALHAAMKYLWENQKIAESMGVEAKQRYLAHFTAHQMAAKYVDLYEKLLGK